SGESLIRNIQEGIRVADGFGRSSRAGFVCDIFGHNSQIPQILSGFGIHSFFMWRGMNEKICSADFRWRSPDGSEVLVHRFGPMWGYCDYDFRVRKANKIDAHPSHEELVQGLIEEVKLLAGRTPAQTLLVFDGGDHIEIEPSTPDLIEEANRHLAADGFQIEFSTLSRFAADIVKEAERITDVVSGELREPGSGVDEQWVIPGVLSSRIDLKMANRDCEDLLCYWAEPFSAIAKRYGLSPCETYLRTAWRFLLQNHPHDSICGCSIEQVHKDMEYRFDQSREIARLVTRDSLRRIAGSVPGEATATRFPVVVANPLTFDRSESIDLTIELPSDCPAYQEFFGFERKPGFRVYDSG
ncbi:MAG: glycoside hydrolase, partial [Candidatus Omnitrophica bacterium]|nr:glycoside hydrolase [Candidatus Omnitrophota bacterium]